MIKIVVDKDSVHTEADGKGIEILTDLCCGVLIFIDDMTKDNRELKPKVIERVIDTLKEFS